MLRVPNLGLSLQPVFLNKERLEHNHTKCVFWEVASITLSYNKAKQNFDAADHQQRQIRVNGKLKTNQNHLFCFLPAWAVMGLSWWNVILCNRTKIVNDKQIIWSKCLYFKTVTAISNSLIISTVYNSYNGIKHQSSCSVQFGLS